MTYIPNRDFLIEVQKGNVAGHALVHKFGANRDVDTGTSPEDVWTPGGLMIHQIAADTLDIVSASANDDGNPTTNTGAQTVTIEGLDASFDLQTETVTMNGVTTVVSVNSYIRVFRAFAATVGTYHGNNEGAIDIIYNGTTDQAAQIILGKGQTEMTHYTVPNAKTGYLLSALLHVKGTIGINAGEADFTLYMVPSADDVSQPFGGAKRVVQNFEGIQGSVAFVPRSPIRFEGKTDIWFDVDNPAANDTAVEIDYELLLVDD